MSDLTGALRLPASDQITQLAREMTRGDRRLVDKLVGKASLKSGTCAAGGKEDLGTLCVKKIPKIRRENSTYRGPSSAVLLLVLVRGVRRPTRWQGLLEVWDACRWGNRGVGDGSERR